MKPSFHLMFWGAKLDRDIKGIVAGTPELQQLGVVDRHYWGAGEEHIAKLHAGPRSFSVKASAAAAMCRQCAMRQARQ